MKHIGVIVLSFEEAGDLSGIVPWKTTDPRLLHHALREQGLPISGLIMLSTCNRVEILYSLSDEEYHGETAAKIIATMPPLRDGIQPAVLQGKRAVRHLIRLSVGLESMVLGETEIRAQLKDAFEDARLNQLVDSRLHLLCRLLFQESRKIRSSIPMANLPLSVATLALKNLERVSGFTDYARAVYREGARVAVIGSGPMSRQAAEYLTKAGYKVVLINRSFDKVEKLCERLSAPFLSFDDFIAQPEKAGPLAGIVTATSRGGAFITPEFTHQLLELRGEQPAALAFVDMALPADIDPACGAMRGVSLISMETLHQELEINRQRRLEAAHAATELVEEALVRLEAELIHGMSTPIVTTIQKEVRQRSREHLELLLQGQLAHLNQRDRRILQAWALQSHRDLNRIHRRGLESVLRNWFSGLDEKQPVATLAHESH